MMGETPHPPRPASRRSRQGELAGAPRSRPPPRRLARRPPPLESIVAIEVADLRFVPQGLELTIPRSKTDQQGHGRIIPHLLGPGPGSYCPDRVPRAPGSQPPPASPAGPCSGAWTAGATSARSACAGALAARIVKRVARAAGLDEDDFGGHSLRAGLVTDAAQRGRSELAITAITGHVSVTMLRRYIREADKWRSVASDGLLEA